MSCIQRSSTPPQAKTHCRVAPQLRPSTDNYISLRCYVHVRTPVISDIRTCTHEKGICIRGASPNFKECVLSVETTLLASTSNDFDHAPPFRNATLASRPHGSFRVERRDEAPIEQAVPQLAACPQSTGIKGDPRQRIVEPSVIQE